MIRQHQQPALAHRRQSHVSDESNSSNLISLGSLEETSRDDEANDPLLGRQILAQNETVSRLRLCVLIVWTVASVWVAAAEYGRDYRSQMRNHQDQVGKVWERVQQQFTVQPVWQQLETLAQDMVIYVEAMQEMEWPNVEVRPFGERAALLLERENDAIWWMPVVTRQEREAWEDYAVHHTDWIEYGDSNNNETTTAAVQRRQMQRPSIAPHIFDAHGAVPPTAPGPYCPLWQMAPITPEKVKWINYNALSMSTWYKGLQTVVNEGQPTVNPVVQVRQRKSAAPRVLRQNDNEVNNEEPYSTIFYPITTKKQNDSVVAVLALEISWMHYFQNTLPVSEQDWVVVIRNACDSDGENNSTSTFTLELKNSTVKFMGMGNLHHGKTSSYATNLTITPTACPYTLHLHPPTALINHNPSYYAGLVLILFIVALGVFCTYDCLVERRQKVVMTHALQSTAIVSSLFPEQVRERLFRRNSMTMERRGSMLGNNSIHGAAEESTLSGAEDASSVRGGENRLRSFLDKWGDGASLNGGSSSRRGSGGMSLNGLVTNPPCNPAVDGVIADSFPNCTVLFADIVGFTAWSSLRDPAQVFVLLESVYQTFDKIARKRKVFKVETIGDSYVAVTGLPEPQEDHALIMCRFARDCRHVMKEITQKLVLTLGPDTEDLKMRFGMHSGPVTAGVLRGEKSRFQLFGDSVNTAARMESTGVPNKIQLSEATAEYLREAGKGHWIKARGELVHAKGKGDLQTYWYEPQSATRRSISSTCSEESFISKLSGSTDVGASAIWGLDEGNTLDLDSYRDKHFRLVEFIVDLMAQRLKQVVAHRQTLQNAGLVDECDEQAPINFYQRHENNECVVDEVSKMVELPFHDGRALTNTVDPDSVELSREVMSQLKRFVTIIGAMYRSNPFHNFEHASHVTMSVNKMLQRVVAPQSRPRRRSMVSRNADPDLQAFIYRITSDPLTQLAVVFAALIHDVDHWGVSNSQLVKEGAQLAHKYKNRSVAEQNSVNVAWDLLMNPDDYPDLQRVIFPTEAEYTRFRSIVIQLVISTDIFEPAMQEEQCTRWDEAFESEIDGPEKADFKATVLLEHIMQASDVSHTMQHWQVYQKWNRRLFDELYTAHKAGRCAMDPSRFWVEGELKFFDSYIIPLAKKLKDCRVFGTASDECLNYAMNNRREWEAKGGAIVAELVSNYEKRDEEERQKKAAEENNNPSGKKKKRFARRRSLFTASASD